MKLVSYLREGHDQVALFQNGLLFNMDRIHPDLPNNMGMLLQYWDKSLPMLNAGKLMIEEGRIDPDNGFSIEDVEILAPVPFPSSLRDAYAFRQHVESARRNRNLPMIPEYDEFPVFYFSNHHSIKGPGEIVCMPDHLVKLDFELEVAAVIGRHGRNIKAEDAEDHIAGLMIMNDFSARTLQMEEMRLNLGPAKGKDFATATGPCLVTLDELEELAAAAGHGHRGRTWNLKMTCMVNGVQVSEGTLADMHWTFAEIIERASYGVDLYPGDIIGSGTVGTGCFLELNGTRKLEDANYSEQWLQQGDAIELHVEGLGTLSNTIAAEETEHTILGLKGKAQ
jgi:fumarylacetoacetate (FAA) hydrolase